MANFSKPVPSEDTIAYDAGRLRRNTTSAQPSYDEGPEHTTPPPTGKYNTYEELGRQLFSSPTCVEPVSALRYIPQDVQDRVMKNAVGGIVCSVCRKQGDKLQFSHILDKLAKPSAYILAMISEYFAHGFPLNSSVNIALREPLAIVSWQPLIIAFF